MKKLFLPLAVLAGFTLFSSCSGSSSGDNSTVQTQQDSSHHENAADTALALNNGSKWTVDSVTSENFVFLKNVAENFAQKPFPDQKQFGMVANDLQNGFNKLIQQCTMKGDAHNELHKWLEPALQNVKDLKNSTDTAQSKKTFDELKGRLENFRNYFNYGY